MNNHKREPFYTLRLLDLPEEVQDMMAEGKLSAGHARAILA
ncbi:MAG: hypothetical protein ACFNM6_07305, partial [Prevotella sp.]